MHEQQTIDLVTEVRKYPCLYNPNLTSYYRKTQTNKVWEKISKVMNLTAMACKEKWRNVRAVYVRHMRNSNIKDKRPYYLSDYMDFLLPYLKKQLISPRGEINIPFSDSTIDSETTFKISDTNEPQNLPAQVENESTIEEDEDILLPPEPKKRKPTLHESERRSHKSIAVTPFLNSLVPELEEMNLQQFKIFKRRAFTLIDEIMDTPLSPRAHSSTYVNGEIKQEIEYTDTDIQDLNHNPNLIHVMSPSDDLNSVASSPSLFEEKHLV